MMWGGRSKPRLYGQSLMAGLELNGVSLNFRRKEEPAAKAVIRGVCLLRWTEVQLPPAEAGGSLPNAGLSDGVASETRESTIGLSPKCRADVRAGAASRAPTKNMER